MAYLTERKFDFVSHALPDDKFGVVRFKGSEGFSICYEFQIDLVSRDAEIDLTAVLKHPVTFTILREEGNIPFHGILAQFEQLHEVDEYVFYRAVLVPKLWWLSLTHHNQVILNKTVPEIIGEVLKDGGLTDLDFELKLQKEYPRWEYICQYRESHLNFVSRWIEREGMYYYFEQTPDGEKVIITDTKLAHTEMPEGKTMYYSPPSGLDEFHREEVIKAFILKQKMLPKTLRLKDYNYRTPSLEISGNAEVSADGRGEVYIYGEHFRTTVEGNDLAKVRAEELLCQERRFHGESTITYLRPGYLFDLEDHYRDSINQQYLTIELEHEGSQAAYLLAGIQKGLTEVEKQAYYRNSFVAIPSDVQFRPERKTEKPRFYGTMNARIDAAGSGKYAELDEHGRYKVVLPLDVSGRKDGKASAYFRMAQPYAGSDHGMHFPLHKGTEVLLTFVDGDPDRPIIAAAVPNPEMPSIINTGNVTGAGFKSASGNQISMQDNEGHERILIGSGDGKTRIICGAGSSSKLLTQSDYQANCADYYMTLASYGTTIANSFSWSAMSGSLIPQVGINLLKRWSQEVAECDELGHRMGAIDKGTHFKNWTKTQETLLSVTPSVLGVMFNSWIMSSLAKHLKRKGLVRKDSEYGQIAQEFTAKWKWKKVGLMEKWKWITEHTRYLQLVARAYGFGTAGSYGVALVSHIPHKLGKWESYDFVKGLVDPRCASLIKLNKASPDVLIASTSGYVDIAGDKGIHLYSGEELHVEALEEATIQSKNLVLTGEAGGRKGLIAINREEKEPNIEVEMGECKIILDDVMGIKASSGASLIKLNVHPPGKPDDMIGTIQIENPNASDSTKTQATEITLENDKCLVKLDSVKNKLELSIRQDKKSDPIAQIEMDLSAKRIRVMAETAVEIDTAGVKIGQGKQTCKSVDVGSDSTRINFRGSEFNFNGK
ncbi:MAG: type VI secretion system tip protein VgrG, partial [Deltaproteobacteria bacterium]|nr:type VI secretion system tip protein VgrG [Deltaproteobacteria bacterium]